MLTLTHRLEEVIEVLELHRKILEHSGGALGIRDIGLLESAIALVTPP